LTVADRADLDLLDLRRVDREHVRSTPTPNDCLRTVNVSRTPAPCRLITIPSKTCTRGAALDHLEVHAHGVARLEARHVAQLGALEVLDDVAHGKRAGRPTAKGSESARSLLKPMRSGGQ
jgi:hypothetical protein